MNKSYLVICIVGLVCTFPAIGDTLNVPSEEYPTIQSAIDAANNGDRVEVAAGTYYENLTWESKYIALIGAGAGVTNVDGGGLGSCLVMRNVPDTARVEGFTFTGGSAMDGGGLYLYESSPTLANNIITRNRASRPGYTAYGGGLCLEYSSPTLTSNTITGNSATHGGGLHLGYSHPTVTNNTITSNEASWGGGLYVYRSSPTLTDNTITHNSVGSTGGGLYVFQFFGTLTNNTIADNSAVYAGGLYLQSCSPTLTNNTITGNSGSFGALWLRNSSPTLTNNTIAFNRVGGINNSPIYPGTPIITNCILWGNGGGDLAGAPSEVTYSDIGVGFVDAVGNISADPMFVGADDYHLQDGSPCIDAGSNSAVSGVETDLDGNPRIVNGIVDMGAFEAPPSCTPVSIDSLTADSLVIPLGNAVNFEATIVDGCGEVDALWDFEDGTVDSQSNVTSPVTTTKTYASAGVYTVVLTVIDDIVNVGDNIIVVVYDPTGGFVTGGGWIISPEGASALDPSLTGKAGKANFGFVSKYKKGTTVPTGNTEFLFKAGNLNFHSTSYNWLVVTGSNYAKFKGKGTINGSGENHFMIWAGDTPDTFRIKIWTEDDGGSETVVYDNSFDQPIGGGSIVIHTK